MNKPAFPPESDELEALSALADGQEADPSTVAAACRHWASNETARVAWHRWHLIGDVLRSDELARAPAHDEAFLTRLRERLAQEPVPLAPRAVARPAAKVSGGAAWALRWRAPAAIAAGGMVVLVAASVLMQPRTEALPGGSLAQADASGSRPTVMTSVVNGQNLDAPPLAPLNAQMLRDTQLDRYLQAHRVAAGALPAASPANPNRRIETVSFAP
jgi:sigma-E factor negative regulatory protein RseA